MRSTRTVVVALALALAFAGAAVAADKAAEVTVAGQLQCAKCTLKAADAKSCQDVLVVAGAAGAPEMHYYLVKNAVAEKFGHVCNGTKNVTMTGTVADKDGKKWLTATKIEEKKG